MSKIDLSRLPHFADTLIGRDTELQRLDDAWNDPAQHVLVIRGIGGEGKTSLVAAWTAQLAGRNYDGASYFDWSFYSQGTRDQTAASSDSFLATALGFFGGDEGKALANSPASARDKAIKLLDYLRKDRTLLVLDGLEPLQYPPGPLAGQLRDDAMSALLKGLAQSNPGLCIVTTREPVTDLARFQVTTAPELELEHLSVAAGAALLQRLLVPTKPKGIHLVKSTLPEREEISRAVKGHALTLRILGSYIHRALRDVRRWREVDYAQADVQYRTNPKDPDTRYGHAFKTIEAYERWLTTGGPHGARPLAVLRLLGLFDRPASGTNLAALRTEPIIPGLTEPLVGLTEEEWNTTLSELEECGLVSLPRSDSPNSDSRNPSLDAHPLLREYFARQLKTQQPEAWRAAHRRLYEHLCATTLDKPKPTLEDLQPLHQAVAHGCHAGMQKEAYDDVVMTRIWRGTGYDGFYSIRMLGAFGSELGALVCFFEIPWRRVCSRFPEKIQASLINVVAFCLRALGRLTEALEPMRAGLEMRIKQETWKYAALDAGNLSELELTLGEVAGALAGAEQSETYADRSNDAPQRTFSLATHADALHQAGQRTEAETRFRKAEQMQAEHQPDYPLLYSLRGFNYCDLLLAAPEHAAWGQDESGRRRDELLAVCRAVSQRAAQALKIAEDNNAPLLTIALDHLTLGRAALFEAILDDSGFGVPRSELDSAVASIRRSRSQNHIPRGLLSRAWLCALTGPRTGPESAQADLDEAWDIAERGPMPLFLADIHMYRARLFFREQPYPWAKNPDGTPRGPKDDLAAARRLIEKHGYWRRKEELEDAEAAAKSWPDASPHAVPVTKSTHTPDGKAPTMIKTVLELDLVGYSTIAAMLQDGDDVETVAKLNQKIQDFIDTGLQAVGLPRDKTVLKTTGDGAILVFDKPSQAHDFADAVQQATRAHNAKKPPGIGKRVFRVGIATGDYVKEDKPDGDGAGMTIVHAVRFEAKAKPGEVLCDPETFAGLTAKQKRLYSGRETITGKRDEKFQAHRCTLNPDGVADAVFFTAQKSEGSKTETAPSPAVAVWKKKLDFLLVEQAKAHEGAARFKLQEDIDDAKAKIRELGGST
jgi:class 3 adenylate cyclase/tetratricopeptide (TPR) repeat protein